MPWSTVILDSFNKVPIDTTDEYLYGPYNMLLNHLFPQDERFEISPQRAIPAYCPDAVDFTMIYLVTRHENPVFFLEIKPRGHLRSAPLRNLADSQMRDHIAVLRHRLTIPKLYGISAMATGLSIYEFHSQNKSLTPKKGEQYDIVPDFAPAENWNYDVLQPEGEAKLREIVKHVKEMSGLPV